MYEMGALGNTRCRIRFTAETRRKPDFYRLRNRWFRADGECASGAEAPPFQARRDDIRGGATRNHIDH